MIQVTFRAGTRRRVAAGSAGRGTALDRGMAGRYRCAGTLAAIAASDDGWTGPLGQS